MLLFLRQMFMMHVCVCVVCVCVCVCVVVVIVHWHCLAQLSMFNMEKRYGNKIIIIIINPHQKNFKIQTTSNESLLHREEY